MDHAVLSHVPSTAEHPEGQLEVAVAYNRGARAAMRLANFIRAQGWEAKAHCGPWASTLSMMPARCVRPSASGKTVAYQPYPRLVPPGGGDDITRLPDAPDASGADDFARTARCPNACPPDGSST
jgi:hypothetical protein